MDRNIVSAIPLDDVIELTVEGTQLSKEWIDILLAHNFILMKFIRECDGCEYYTFRRNIDG